MRHHYSDADRARVLAMLDANGGNVGRTARDAEVPKSTLRRWVADRDRAAPGAQVRTEKETLADAIEAAAWQMIGVARDSITKGDQIPLDQLPRLWTAIGIAIDKLRLLRDQATAITETRDWRRLIEEEGIDPSEVLAEAERILAGD